MDFFALSPEMEEVEEATTSSQGTIDEEMSVEKQNKESEKDKKDKKDKKKKKKKSKKEKKRKDETKKEKKRRRERQDTDAWQKYMDIEDGDTVALAKFIEDVSEPLARAKKTGKRTFLDLCGGAGDVARRAEARHDHIGLGMDWKQGPIRVDLKKPCIYNYIELEIVEEGLAGSAMLHNPCETWCSARHGRPRRWNTSAATRQKRAHLGHSWALCQGSDET